MTELEKERLIRVRTEAVDQAIGVNLPNLAKVCDTSTDPGEILDAAVHDLCRRLYIDPDQARLAVIAGVIVGAMTRSIRCSDDDLL